MTNLHRHELRLAAGPGGIDDANGPDKAPANPTGLPSSYSVAQIVLHWLIVVLVLFQLLFGTAMSHLMQIAQHGETPDAGTVQWANAHRWVGLTILATAVPRFGLRFLHGAPPPAGDRVMVRVAAMIHWVFYLLLFAMPITGILAYYLWPALGPVHRLGKPVFIVLIVVHAGAAAWHHFVKRDDVLKRMVVPTR